MDAATLSSLLSESTEKLTSLHAEIGHPPEQLNFALESLHQALRSAVDTELHKVSQQVQDLKDECNSAQHEITLVRKALGDKNSVASLQTAVGRRMVSASQTASNLTSSTEAEAQPFPLLQRRTQLSADRQRLKSLYATREAQHDRLITKLNSYVPLLGKFVKMPTLCPIPSDVDGQPSQYKDVTQPKIASIEAEIIRCSKELTTRAEKLQTNLVEIVQLWSELHLEPCQPIDLGDEQVFTDNHGQDNVDCGGATLQFEKAVLTHLQLRPIHNDDGKFVGEFVTTAAQDADSDDADLDQAAQGMVLLGETPTRSSLGGLPAKQNADLVLRLPSRSLKPNTATPISLPNHLLEPTETNLDRAACKREWLEAEKLRREVLIQDLYDNLSQLWAKFDVPEEEMDAFVLDHRGSTLEVVQAYQSELEKMTSLKTQHMSLFILKTRERIASLWDSLFLSQHEREASFPAFFIDVSSNEPNEDPLPTDEILASHEEMIDQLTEQVRIKAPVLKVIGKYKELLQEAKQLDESAADCTRLLGRSNRGDPGRLLREERMRKRVKVQKPKLEAELLQVIPAWEEGHGEPFTINGMRYLDELMEQIEGSKENQRKRTRTVSGSQPQSCQNRGNATVLTSLGQANRNVASTPMRSVTPHQLSTKKSVAAPPSTVSSARYFKTPGSAVVTSSRAASARAPTSSARRLPSSSQTSRPMVTPTVSRSVSHLSYAQDTPALIPLPASPPKTLTKTLRSRTASGTSHVVAQREGFRPRPSSNVKTHQVANPHASAKYGQLSPGRASKWGDMGPPNWPAAGPIHKNGPIPGGQMNGRREVSTASNATSVQSDMTTVIHPTSSTNPREPGKKYRRAPSMSLETCLANLAAASVASVARNRLGDGAADLGICSIRSISSSTNGLGYNKDEDEMQSTTHSRIHGWKDGLRFAGAEVEAEVEEEPEQPAEMPRSGSGSNWEMVNEDDQDMIRYGHSSNVLAT